MAIRASNITPGQQYQQAKRFLVALKSDANNRATVFASGGTAQDVMTTLDLLLSARTNLDRIRTIPGVAEYAQAQENDPAYDVAAEFNALYDLVVAAITEIVTTFPVSSPGGYVEEYTLAADGSRSYNVFTGPQLSALVTALQSIASAIE